ncbi:voltage-gated potassium channel [Catalinimonas alkaloidigena]|uniref:potassium channel family protein n=1 Tax=Catalinimonas alkaloidigena TaxID=1075417 RepID=UPI002404B1D2|nr:potassium channel protein [Catalinimonas alkaloidigena]MDF9799576.1 voltage-gated potassium channel [Catalinimonas alkaloidigena]
MSAGNMIRKIGLKKIKLGRITLGLSLLLFSVLIGMVGFITLEGYSMLEAFYMAIITLSTVGFTEVQTLSDNGRLFTSFYIIFNLGIFAYAISIITTYIVEGEFKDIFHQYMISKRVQRMQNHIIVCGFGRNGTKTCAELLKSQRSFILIEKDVDLVDSFPSNNNFEYIIGDATSDEILLTAGIERAGAIITTLPRDADNVFITLTARELNPKVKIISRATEERASKKLYRAGANQVVMPDAIGGIHMAQLITKPEVIEFLNLLTGVSSEHLKLEDFSYNELKDEFKDKTIMDLDIRRRTGATVIGFKSQRHGFTITPPGDLKITEGDTMIIIGNAQNISAFKKTYG